MSKKKKIIIGVLALAVLVAAFLLVYFLAKPQTVSGSKSFTLTIVDDEGNEKEYFSKTDQEYLYGALLEIADLSIEGEEGPYGFTIYTINGVEANYNTGSAFWSLYVNGEYGNYGVSEQPVNDGDTFALKYETF